MVYVNVYGIRAGVCIRKGLGRRKDRRQNVRLGMKSGVLLLMIEILHDFIII